MATDVDRRTVLGAASLSVALPAARAAATVAAGRGAVPPDWDRIAEQYDVTREVVQLEHGNWGMMARPVLAEYRRQTERVNRDTSYYARRTMVPDLEAARAALAAELGVAPEEIALTRNATEALKALILQYNRLGRGDAVLLSDLDYDSMQGAMAALPARRGVRLVRIALPEPATYQGLIDAYVRAFDANRDLKMVLLTHACHRSGLVLPVAPIAEAARARGIDVIVDAAHSVGMLDFRLPMLKADFVGLNVHKWLGAPIGCGALYIRRGRLDAIDPDPVEIPGGPIHTRVHSGTLDFAAHLTIPAALAFRRSIGADAIEARVRALRDRWVAVARTLPGVQVIAPDDPRLHGAITSFRLTGQTSHAQNVALARTLLDRFRIFTVYRDGLASGSCVRVTPALATRMADVDALGAALRVIAAR